LHAHAESPTRAAVSATLHCLTGCAIGEVVGMAISTALAWGNAASIVVSVVLAFVFGYSLTFGAVLRAGVGFRRAAGIAFAADTVSIVIMEAVDNAFVAVVPGALEAGLGDAKFWWSIGLGFVIAFGPAFAANRWLIGRGRGHAVAHAYH
jgi:hypothetical protein